MGLCSPIKVMGVVGAGQMGSGIAQIAAVMAHDIHVLMTDIDHVSLSRGLHAISSSLSRSVKKGSLSQVTLIPLLALVSSSMYAVHLCFLLVLNKNSN